MSIIAAQSPSCSDWQIWSIVWEEVALFHSNGSQCALCELSSFNFWPYACPKFLYWDTKMSPYKHEGLNSLSPTNALFLFTLNYIIALIEAVVSTCDCHGQ